MKKVFKFVKGKRDERRDGTITPSQSADLISPAQTPEDERFLGLDNSAGYIVDFCGKDKTLTKLHKAAWQGNLDKVKNALKKIDIDAVDRHNRTALHFAVVQGHPNIVWFLLGNNARHTICDDEGRTPLLKAVECGHKECINLLLERGANINHADFSGSTSLHIAVKLAALDVVTTLMQKGADPEVANNVGDFPLHMALRSQNKNMIQQLLQLGASVNAVDRENRTPLMLAAKTGNLLLAQLFFEFGAQLCVVDSNGWTAEDYALLGGHQNVATELKTLMKKDAKPLLETHTEEDEIEASKSETETWNDSHLSDKNFEPNGGEAKKRVSIDIEEELVESPGSGVVPPPCQPPRSWEIIEAGMIDEATADGSEPKRLNITALGSLHSRRESFTDNSGSEGSKHTLSLNRRREPRKANENVKQRFSFNEEESLRSSISDDFSLFGEIDKGEGMMRFKRKDQIGKKHKSDSGSDWDSNLSSLLESGSHSEMRVCLDGLKETPVDGSMNQVDELLLPPSKAPLPPGTLIAAEKSDSSSNWDSEGSFQNEAAFPPPPTALELGVDMAKSLSYIKGISIDHAPESSVEKEIWRSCYEGQSHSLDCLDEGDTNEMLELEKTATSKRHIRQASISNQKWRSVELPKQQRPADRLIDVNRRINEQLECYDQALRELAESSYAKRQDALISTLSEPKSSNVENYYSLPSSKFKTCRESGFQNSSASSLDYALSLPPQFTKKAGLFSDQNSGPQSLPFSVNEGFNQLAKAVDLENNEKLGFEENGVWSKQKPNSLDFKPPELPSTENLESPMSDEQTGSDKSDRKSKRHMLLAMRDVKHAVQVTNSFKTSLDDQILSPLTKTDGVFDLSPKKSSPAATNSQGASPGEENLFFCAGSQSELGRQETVIERTEFRRKSSSSESGEEPTLWLQEHMAQKNRKDSSGTSDDEGDNVPGSNNIREFSPLGAVYEELKAERLAEKSSSSNRRLSMSDEDSVSARKQGDLDENSPDISFSSGPIEPLGKDSGSEPESSRQDPTPIHHYSLKKHHKWLKDRLASENKERHQLEEVATQLAEKAERLQYELADAKEATKSRDEIIALLQAQLSRMEVAYTKSLEESVHCRLQLTTLEQEILHLKEVCAQYEEERDSRSAEKIDKQYADLVGKVRQLEEEREGLSRIVVRLEQENRTLETLKNKEQANEANIWTERDKERLRDNKDSQLVEPSSHHIKDDHKLTIRNTQLETQLILLKEKNKHLEFKLETLLTNQSAVGLSTNRANLKYDKEYNEVGNKSELKSGETILHNYSCTKQFAQPTEEATTTNNDDRYLLELGSLKKENKVLNETIERMQHELLRLKQWPNAEQATPSISNDGDLKEIRDDEHFYLPGIVGELRKEVQELHLTLEETRRGNLELEKQMKSLSTVGRPESFVAKTARDDELAWSNLYGIKHVRRQVSKQKPAFSDKTPDDMIQRKVRELENMLQKAKDEINRQRLDHNFQNIYMDIENTEVTDLKERVNSLESALVKEKAYQTSNVREKAELEFELENLKSQILQEYVPKMDVEVEKFRREMIANGNLKTADSMLDERLREQCSVLGEEKSRAEEIRRRLGRHFSSWEEGDEDRVVHQFAPLSRNRPVTQSTSVLLDDRATARIYKQFEKSLRRCGLESPPENVDVMEAKYLKKNYLC